MYYRQESRWTTKFGSWVNDVGVRAILAHLNSDPSTTVTRYTIYKWLSGHSPAPRRASAMVKLSAGAITLDDIYGHSIEMHERRRRGLD